MWEDYNFWCVCLRCTATEKIIAVPVVDGEADKLASMYDILSETVHCATTGCRGCNVPEGSSGTKIEEGLSPMYHCSICDRNDGLDATLTTRNGLLQAVDDYWP